MNMPSTNCSFHKRATTLLRIIFNGIAKKKYHISMHTFSVLSLLIVTLFLELKLKHTASQCWKSYFSFMHSLIYLLIYLFTILQEQDFCILEILNFHPCKNYLHVFIFILFIYIYAYEVYIELKFTLLLKYLLL